THALTRPDHFQVDPTRPHLIPFPSPKSLAPPPSLPSPQPPSPLSLTPPTLPSALPAVPSLSASSPWPTAPKFASPPIDSFLPDLIIRSRSRRSHCLLIYFMFGRFG
uniref:Uncharacterized protein n=1 Tax=Aegilops tauschii subsp. strangulata TaxID=200361 RepID=A0A453EKJ9_AEGTS